MAESAPLRRLPPWFLGAGAIALVALLAPMPRLHRAWSVPLDLGHVVLGAALTWGVSCILRWRGWHTPALWWIAWIVASVLLGAAEAVQPLTGRAASLHDLIANTLGGLGAALWGAARDGGLRPSRRWLALVPWALASAFPALTAWDTLVQTREHPVLAEFTSVLELSRWRSKDGTFARIRRKDTEDGWALEVRLPPGAWPSVIFGHPAPDWTGYRALQFDVHVETAQEMHFKVVDRRHNERYDDRFNTAFDLRAGWQTLEVPLAAIASGPAARKLDLSVIDAATWFVTKRSVPTVFRLDRIRLVK